ncbi:hypothetical protein OKW38_000360 [Paraburkholderia sp. MM5496-R1]|nr:hypothetical protein [Paraburkholderia sprentiae]
MSNIQGGLSSPEFIAQADGWLDSWTGRVAAMLVGFIFVGWIAHDLHSDPRWKWHAGTGKLPHEVVHEFMDMAYAQGHGSEAYKEYFSAKAIDTAPQTVDHRDGEPIPDHVKKVIVEGFDVAVYHTIGAARGQAAQDVVDVFQLDGSGWIIRRDRLTAPVQEQAANTEVAAQKQASK